MARGRASDTVLVITLLAMIVEGDRRIQLALYLRFGMARKAGKGRGSGKSLKLIDEVMTETLVDFSGSNKKDYVENRDEGIIEEEETSNENGKEKQL